jgi:hypothetical protein
MKAKIYGDEKTLTRVKNAKPGDPCVYVNLEAIDELPDQFEVHIKKVEFDPAKDFDQLGKADNYMPSPKVMNDIADKRGIEGTAEIRIEAIYEEVNINPMLCKPIEAEPTIRKIIVGKRVIKVGKVLMEDGTYRSSDPCSVDFNVWERCVIDWSEEEEATSGYDPAIVKHGKYTAFEKTFEGAYYEKKFGASTYQYGCKYENKFKRKSNFDTLMKFAQRQADTKARHVVIRVLAGLKTGYKKSEIAEGAFYFPQIQRSRLMLKMETAARLQAIANGNENRRPQALLFSPTETEEPRITLADDEPEPFAVPDIEQPVVKTKRERLIDTLTTYQKENVIPAAWAENVKAMLSWLTSAKDADTNSAMEKHWVKCIGNLIVIEKAIPEAARVRHELY